MTAVDPGPVRQEDVLDLEKEILRLISRKQAAEQHIVTLEARLYDLETEYFKETMAYGNIIRGLEGYHGARSSFTGPLSAAAAGHPRRPGHSPSGVIKDSERVFSNTSSSWSRSVRLQRAATGGDQDDFEYEGEQQDGMVMGGAESENDDDEDDEEDDEDEEVSPRKRKRRQKGRK